MPPRTNIDRLYDAVRDRQDAKYDRRNETRIHDYPLSERELAEIAAASGETHDRQPPAGTHIERWIE